MHVEIGRKGRSCYSTHERPAKGLESTGVIRRMTCYFVDSLIQSRPCTIYVNQPHNNDVTSKTKPCKPSALSLFRSIYQLRQLTHRHRRRTILAATVLRFLTDSAYNPDPSRPPFYLDTQTISLLSASLQPVDNAL